MKKNSYWLILVSVLALASCATNAPGSSREEIALEQVPVGKNVVGEECFTARGTVAYEPSDLPANRVINVYCGDWEWPSARIFEVEKGGDNIADWITDNPWRDALADRMLCVFDEESRILGGVRAVLLDCRLNNGGWPYVALIANVDGKTYLADGIPASLPPIENAIAAAVGLPVSGDVTELSAATRHLQTRLGDRMYAAADLQGFYRAMLLGQYYNSTKSFGKAEREYWRALAVHEKSLGTDNADTASPLMHIALELSNQEQFGRAEALFVSVRNKLDPDINVAQYSRYLSYYALHAANQGRFEVARRLASESTEIRKILATRLSAPADTADTALAARRADADLLSLDDEVPHEVEVAHSLYIEAAMLERQGADDFGDQKLARAQLIVEVAASAPPLWQPQMFSLGAHVEDARQHNLEASAARGLALSLFEARAPGERPTALSLLESGNALRKAQRPGEALRHYRLAADLARSRSDSFRISQIAPYLNTLLQVAEQEGADRDALNRELFEAAQLVRSGVTARDIASTVARFAERDDGVGKVMSELQNKEFERVRFQQEYQAELGRILETGHVERLQAINSKIQGIYEDIGELSHQIQTVSPRYKQLIGAAVRAADVATALAPGEALLQVVVGENETFAILMRDGIVTAHAARIPAAEIAAVVNRMRKRIGQTRGVALVAADEVIGAASSGVPVTVDASDIAADDHGVAVDAFVLYSRLIEPLAARLDGVTHLVTVASGPFLSFPFGLFVTAPPPAANVGRSDYHANVAWLAAQVPISLVPSAQSFVYLRNLADRSSAPRSLLAFGGYTAKAKASGASRGLSLPLCAAEPEATRDYFANLPGTIEEIAAVSRMFPGAQSYVGADFTEAAVKNAALADYRVVYFATHALLPDEVECRSEPALLASLPGAEGEDGFLNGDEILQLKMNADLVVLSACNTGGADKASGESLTGLARSFFFAGARSLLVSHWSLPDEATSQLMQNVFQKLKNSTAVSVADALRQAQADMLRSPTRSEWSHPFYWAGFSLVGDGAQNLAGI